MVWEVGLVPLDIAFWELAIRPESVGVERSVHYERVHESQSRTLNTMRNGSNNAKAKPAPELYGAFVCADHKIGLQAAEASRSCVPYGVLAHRRRNTLAAASGAVT